MLRKSHTPRHRRTAFRKLGWKGTLVAVGTALATLVVVPTVWAAQPKPVYAPSGSVADPGLLRTSNGFYAYTTGKGATVSHAGSAGGSWKKVRSALDLSDAPSWIVKSKDIWAPDVVHTSAGYVMYFSAVTAGFGDQRCIGTAVSTSAAGPFKPVKKDPPLVCPSGRHGSEDKVAGRPVAGAGVIDPSPFTDSAGRRFLLYKTQKTPSSIRMLRLGSGGVHSAGAASGELVRRDGIIENPVMIQKGKQYVLFTSRYGYNNCSYATTWLRSTDKWHFKKSAEHSLMKSNADVCGPGGADVTRSLDAKGWRIFLHGWVCGTGTKTCTNAQLSGKNQPKHRRALYARVLTWGKDGATPHVGAFL